MADYKGKKTLTRDEYLQLRGLQAMYRQRWKEISAIERSMGSIIGSVPDNYLPSHWQDMMADARNFDEGLELMGITVTDPPKDGTL